MTNLLLAAKERSGLMTLEFIEAVTNNEIALTWAEHRDFDVLIKNLRRVL